MGAQIEPINGLKAKNSLVYLAVGGEQIRFPALSGLSPALFAVLFQKAEVGLKKKKKSQKKKKKNPKNWLGFFFLNFF